VFGFASLGKVLDVMKLNKALNNVFFWEFQMFAKVARFDRKG